MICDECNNRTVLTDGQSVCFVKHIHCEVKNNDNYCSKRDPEIRLGMCVESGRGYNGQ